MKKKSLLITIIILVVIAIIVIGVSLFLAYKDIDARNQLIAQINALNENNLNTEVTLEGDYGLIEKVVKEDYKTYYESINKLRDNYDKLSSLAVLNIENFENDGPEFTASLETLNTIKTENENMLAALNDLADDVKIEEKLAANNITGENKSLYREIITELKLKEGVVKIKESDTKFSTYLGSLIDVLTYLKDNKNEWFIENGALKSKSQAFIDQYNQKVQAIEGMETTTEGQN
ncbi:MAG: hypothetical protein IJX34_04075 [Clostridia bacterium]|nr:hypothetical protein [Clostridia bacterium]